MIARLLTYGISLFLFLHSAALADTGLQFSDSVFSGSLLVARDEHHTTTQRDTMSYNHQNNPEEISSFDANIVVNEDASITVTETIQVYVAGEIIKRGLVRSLPLTDSNISVKGNLANTFNHLVAGPRHQNRQWYHLLETSRNNEKSAFHTAKENTFLSIYFGDKNILIEPGWYTYKLTYNVPFTVNFLPDRDEIYWNVTGNQWPFNILQASATVTLPKNVSITSYSAFTGTQGKQGQDYTAQHLSPNQIAFQTTTVIYPGSGFTIAVGWPKNIISEPSLSNQVGQITFLAHSLVNKIDLSRFTQTNKSTSLIAFIFVLAFIFFITTWYQHGRDPKKGTIIPLFYPPRNLSPTMVKNIFCNCHADGASLITIWFVDMAIRGFITIDKVKSRFIFTKTKKVIDGLDNNDKSLMAILFDQSDSMEVSRSNMKKLNKAKDTITTKMTEQAGSNYYINNYHYAYLGLAIYFTSMIIGIITSNNIAFSFLSIVFTILFIAFLLFIITEAFESLFSFKLISFVDYIFRSFLLLIIIILPYYFIAYEYIPLINVILISITFFMMIWFFVIIGKPTIEGRKLMDEMEGFKLFLETTKGRQLKTYDSPTLTIELYEKYLPYALALGVENQWSEKIQQTLAESGIDLKKQKPSWYHSSDPAFKGIPSSLNQNLIDAIQSATPPSSTSRRGSGGGSGGGSSGGGSGGGGGGGW